MVESAEGFESFVAIVDAGSITAAARTLGVPRETLSRRLQRLEARLATRLAHRSTRKLVLTEAGRTLYERARPLVLAAREAAEALRRLDGVPRGVLRVSLPPVNSDMWTSQLLVPYLAAYPEVSVEAEFSARHVDLVAEGFDVALRAGTVHEPSLMARTLHSFTVRAAASKEYLDRRGRPERPEDLADHDLILGMRGGTQPTRSWATVDGRSIPVVGRLVVNDLQVAADAIRGGAGIGRVVDRMLAAELASGEVEYVLPDHLRSTASISVVFVERELMPPKVRSFVDHVVRWMEQNPLL